MEYINDNLTPKETERKQSGEVFTPMWVVNEMLDKLPAEVWSNPDFRWLDPAVGIGNFPISVYLRLMEGLKNHRSDPDLTDEEARRKHILEKMLFMVEISKKSIIILNKIFCGDTYKLNIHPESFLDADYKPESFNVIMGNPPYNPPKGPSGKSSGISIWQNFVMK